VLRSVLGMVASYEQESCQCVFVRFRAPASLT
jgi:hypothetical protein